MTCFVCGQEIIEARAQFLKESGVAETHATCVKHSQTQRKQGVYTGEHGTSDMILCRKVYNDDLRSKFRGD